MNGNLLHLLVWQNSGYSNATFSYLRKYQLTVATVNYLKTINSQFYHVLVDSSSEVSNFVTSYSILNGCVNLITFLTQKHFIK